MRLQQRSLIVYLKGFNKKDQSRTNVTEGSGLGLAIAKSNVELHGGTIHAKYKNETLYFVISLPFTT
ncbi:sensor histidine kinase [Bacillus sp. B14905]|nr:sensor histidine kinase [Bacillus sp. B14905]